MAWRTGKNHGQLMASQPSLKDAVRKEVRRLLDRDDFNSDSGADLALDAFETAAAESLQGNREPSPECRSDKTPAETQRKPQLDGSPLSAESMFGEIIVSETGAAPSSPATVSPLVPQTRVDPEVPLTNKDLDAKKTTVEPEVPLSNKDLVAKNGGHQKPDQDNKVAKGGLASSGSMEFYATESEAGHDDESEKPLPRKGMKRPAAAQPEKTNKKPAASFRGLKRPAAAVSPDKEKEAAESEAGLMPPAAEEVTATPEKEEEVRSDAGLGCCASQECQGFHEKATNQLLALD